MAQVLHFDLPQDELHPAFNRLDLDLAQSGEAEDEDQQPMQLNIANAVWAQQGYPFLPEYLDLLALNYGAGLHLADFTTQAEPTRKEINHWVSDQTEERIKDLMAPGCWMPPPAWCWSMPFTSRPTGRTSSTPMIPHQAPFYLLDGADVQVDMMSNTMFLPYLRGENYQAVELPYAGGTAAMDIILPDEGQFAAFEAAPGLADCGGILASMQPVDLQLSMPKFTYSSEFELARAAGRRWACRMPSAPARPTSPAWMACTTCASAA